MAEVTDILQSTPVSPEVDGSENETHSDSGSEHRSLTSGRRGEPFVTPQYAEDLVDNAES